MGRGAICGNKAGNNRASEKKLIQVTDVSHEFAIGILR